MAVETQSNSEVFQRVWELYAAGRGPEILEHLDPDVEWRPRAGRARRPTTATTACATWAVAVAAAPGRA